MFFSGDRRQRLYQRINLVIRYVPADPGDAGSSDDVQIDSDQTLQKTSDPSRWRSRVIAVNKIDLKNEDPLRRHIRSLLGTKIV